MHCQANGRNGVAKARLHLPRHFLLAQGLRVGDQAVPPKAAIRQLTAAFLEPEVLKQNLALRLERVPLTLFLQQKKMLPMGQHIGILEEIMQQKQALIIRNSSVRWQQRQ